MYLYEHYILAEAYIEGEICGCMYNFRINPNRQGIGLGGEMMIVMPNNRRSFATGL
jgi:hypothetical protein